MGKNISDLDEWSAHLDLYLGDMSHKVRVRVRSSVMLLRVRQKEKLDNSNKLSPGKNQSRREMLSHRD